MVNSKLWCIIQVLATEAKSNPSVKAGVVSYLAANFIKRPPLPLLFTLTTRDSDIMKFRPRRGAWIIVPLIILLFISKPSRANAFFDSFDSLSGWTIEQNGGNGVIADGSLKFSYFWGAVSKTVVIEQPSVVTLSIDVFTANGRMNDSWYVQLGDQMYYQNNVYQDWQTVTIQKTTTNQNELLTIRIAGVDNGFWWGWYGPHFDNLSVQVESLIPTTTTVEETTTTTETPTTTTTIEEVTTTTTEPPVETTIPEKPVETTTTTTTTSTTVAETTTTLQPTTTTSPVTIPETTTTIPPVDTTTPEEIVIDENISQEQVVSLILDPEVLGEISVEDAEKLFEVLEVEELTEEEKAELIQAVTNAPEDVKTAFENEVNVYALGLDTYVPVGSKVDVGTRRALIAATAAAAIVTQVSPNSSGQTTDNKRRK